MIEAGAPSTRKSCRFVVWGVPAPPGVVMIASPEVPRNEEGAKRRPRQKGSKSAAKGIIEAGVLHLASRQRRGLILREDCYNAVTRAPTVGNDPVVPDSKRERGECMLAMLFWVLAGLAVVGALAIDWGLYLLARRWL
jgi:hypothetical protein